MPGETCLKKKEKEKERNKKNYSLGKIPQAQDSLNQHPKHARYQSFLWIEADITQQEQLDSANLG